MEPISYIIKTIPEMPDKALLIIKSVPEFGKFEASAKLFQSETLECVTGVYKPKLGVAVGAIVLPQDIANIVTSTLEAFNDAATAASLRKVSWLPDGYNYAAMDRDGQWFMFHNKPVIRPELGIWVEESHGTPLIGVDPMCTSWTLSLSVRG